MDKSKKRHRPIKCIAHRPVLRRTVEEDGTELTTIGREHFKIPSTFFQTYDNIFEVIVKLDFLSLLLLHYIGTRMGEDSSIYLNIHEKTRFLEEIQKHGDKHYTMGSINNAIGKLKEAGFMRSINNATFYVNPIYMTRYINNDDRKTRIVANEKWRFKKEHGLPIYTDTINAINQKSYSPF